VLAIEILREHPKTVQKAIDAKGEKVDISRILGLDQDRRNLLSKINELRAERNTASLVIGTLKKSGGDAAEAIAAVQSVGSEIRKVEFELNKINGDLNPLLLKIPNLPHSSVPIGKNEKNNVLLNHWGDKPDFNFKPKSHMDIGAHLNLFDFQRGAKLSGSGFPLYIGQGAKLERALINYMLDYHTNNFGYTEIFPPFLTRGETLEVTGQLPKLADDMYKTDNNDLYLIPTAEVPLTNMHRDEILNEAELPLNYVAYSACFRREAGSYGKDTRGYLRLHQFNKVELVKFVTPDSSYDELEVLTSQAEAILEALGLHYRKQLLCTGELSFAAAKCYDLEVWAPGEKQWLEVSSCSNYESFQARRGNIRWRRDSDSQVDFVHTLNGSGLATPRLLIALLETYQKSNGEIEIPEVLRKYMEADVLQ